MTFPVLGYLAGCRGFHLRRSTIGVVMLTNPLNKPLQPIAPRRAPVEPRRHAAKGRPEIANAEMRGNIGIYRGMAGASSESVPGQ